jgi:1-acyl-sn-glycerol-3-phosphate acyltransferase
MDAKALHERARRRGANRFLVALARMILVPFFRVYFRMARHGREHIPAEGGVLLAANHRSFLDPFVLGTMTRRPIHYVAKKELFVRSWQGWILNALGAFPVDRGASDGAMLETARAILDRGDIVLIFPEGTRIRPGGLGRPKRGVGRLALEAGVPVVPLAINGTEAIRRGWRIRPHRVTVRAGRPLTFPHVQEPSPQLAQAVTDRIWPCVALQWEWLGGLAPLRRATVIGAGAWGTALAVTLQRAGLDVQLGTRTLGQAEVVRVTGENPDYLPGIALDGIEVGRAADLDLSGSDLVVLAVPSPALAHVLAAHAERIPASAGVVVVANGLVAPLGTLPCAFASERVTARAVACIGGPAEPADTVASGASLVVGSTDRAFAAQLVQVLAAAGLDATRTADVTGLELAGIARSTAALAATAATPAGPNAAAAAASRVLAEVDALARRAGARDSALVSAVLAAGPTHTAEAVVTLPLLTTRLRDERLPAHAVSALADVIDGRVTTEEWAAGLTSARGRRRSVAAA